jgi:hypothetical protein
MTLKERIAEHSKTYWEISKLKKQIEHLEGIYQHEQIQIDWQVSREEWASFIANKKEP